MSSVIVKILCILMSGASVVVILGSMGYAAKEFVRSCIFAVQEKAK